MNFKTTWITATLVVLAMTTWTASAVAETTVQVRNINLASAYKAAEATRAQCEKDGYKVSVAVVDMGGNLKAQIRGDGAGPHTVDSSFRKAYTSASLGRPTMDLAKLVVKMPAIQALGKMNENILLLGGGLPIQFDGVTVGGIGVGGAPGAHLDEACAKAGLKAIGAKVPEAKKE